MIMSHFLYKYKCYIQRIKVLTAWRRDSEAMEERKAPCVVLRMEAVVLAIPLVLRVT